MSARERNKGNVIEREIVNRHKDIGVHAERYPASGATHFRGAGHDVDLYPFGVDEAPLVAEVKGRGQGDGFRMLERWLGDYDVLFLRRDRRDPLVVLPWETWQRLVGGKAWLREHRRPLQGAISGAPAAQDEGGANGKTERPTNGTRAGVAASAARQAKKVSRRGAKAG